MMYDNNAGGGDDDDDAGIPTTTIYFEVPWNQSSAADW
jgi:hypothetical protein